MLTSTTLHCFVMYYQLHCIFTEDLCRLKNNGSLFVAYMSLDETDLVEDSIQSDDNATKIN